MGEATEVRVVLSLLVGEYTGSRVSPASFLLNFVKSLLQLNNVGTTQWGPVWLLRILQVDDKTNPKSMKSYVHIINVISLTYYKLHDDFCLVQYNGWVYDNICTYIHILNW